MREAETETGGLLGLLDFHVQWDAVRQENQMDGHRVKPPRSSSEEKMKMKTVSIMIITKLEYDFTC